MKRILVIAPSSYPIHQAEAIVNSKLLKALHKSGKFEIDLVSQSHKFIHYPKESIDIDIKSLHIVETSLKPDFESIYLHAKALFYFGITYKGIHWAMKALPIVKKLVKGNKYDYVLTKDGASYVLGYYLKKKYGMKWISTCNDPFPTNKYPEPYGRGYDAPCNYKENYSIKAIEHSDAIVFPSDRLRDYMLKYVKIDRSKTIIIPHVILEKGNKEKAIDYSSKLKIVHSGNLKAPRNPETFLKALHKFKNERGSVDLDVYVMGAFDAEMTEMIKELGLEENIKLIPPMKYSESIEKLKEFDMALIIEAPCEEGIFLPTKVTDFIQEKIRIFTISPATGVLKDMYNKGMVEFFADVTNIDDIYETLSEIYDTFKQGNLKRIEQSDIYEFTEDAIVKQHLDF